MTNIPVVDDIHGIKISDPYRWLEKNSPRTKKWLSAQERVTNAYFTKLDSRNKLKEQFKELLDKDVENIPVVRGKQYFFRKRKRGEDQPSLYVKHGLKGKAVLLLNPSKHKFGTIEDWSVSKNAKYIALEFSLSSNDRHTIRIFDVTKKKFIKDTITGERYPYFQTWSVDSSGFWYIRGEIGHPISEEKYYKRIYYHILGQPISSDKFFFGADLLKDEVPTIHRSHDGAYQMITIHHSNRNTTVYFRDTQNANSNFISITKNIEAFSSAQAEDGYIYLYTNHNAPNCKVLRREINNNSLGKWEVFVPESKFKLVGCVLRKRFMFLGYIENVYSQAYLINLKTRKTKRIKLPGLGSIGAHSSTYDGNELFFNFSALNIPPSTYKLDLKNMKQRLYWRKDIKLPKDLELKQEWVKSKDGTKIPMFVLKDKNNNNPSPALVYAYGGFRINQLPNFRTSIIPFIKAGGIYVLANIRGGGEFGEKWHEAVLTNKQHKRFEDLEFILKYLISRKYTTSDKLAIQGGSNGGLLMSVMALRYPKLFKAALIDMPVTDMLRFHLFHGGRHWINEYGNPENKKMRKYLLSYSPYHNIGKENYPAMMITTAEHDDRVHPMHAYKFFAKLKENDNQKNTLLLEIEKNAGHGGSGKLSETIDRLSRSLAFICKELGLKI